MSQGGAKGLHAHAVLLTAENHGPFYSHPGSEKVGGLPRAAQREGRGRRLHLGRNQHLCAALADLQVAVVHLLVPEGSGGEGRGHAWMKGPSGRLVLCPVLYCCHPSSRPCLPVLSMHSGRHRLVRP